MPTGSLDRTESTSHFQISSSLECWEFSITYAMANKKKIQTDVILPPKFQTGILVLTNEASFYELLRWSKGLR